MAEPLADQIMQRIGQAAELYHRLVMLVAPTGSGKTAALQDVHKRTAAPLINVSLELSRRMLDLTERQRSLQLPRLFSEMENLAQAELVLLDNLEILFDVLLRQDPLRLLQGLSRNRTIVAAWTGSVDAHHLIYAAPGHPEYRRYGNAETSGILMVYYQRSQTAFSLNSLPKRGRAGVGEMPSCQPLALPPGGGVNDYRG